MHRISVALSARVDVELRSYLLRADGQEDVCLTTYSRSTGAKRDSTLLHAPELPMAGERVVHGNASFTGDYVVRVATLAAKHGFGVAVLHSHPSGRGWQAMSPVDEDSERSFAYLVYQITGLRMIGMTLAGDDHRWSARSWDKGGRQVPAESVRVVGSKMRVSWNDSVRAAPSITNSQSRTVSAWGPSLQDDIARLRVLVVGVGSVGLDVAQRLVASGVQHVGVMDFDSVETINLDRMIGATKTDVRLNRSKTQVAARLMRAASTADRPVIVEHEISICEAAGLAEALDYDVIFSCVDRPWPRAVLNTIAYSDLIPVIDGGIAIDAFADGGMRGASWRSHVILPGRPCLACNGQLKVTEVALDRDGSLDHPRYIAGMGSAPKLGKQNVAMLSASVSAGLLAQFVSLLVAPGGVGEPGPLQYHLVGHSLEHLRPNLAEACYFEQTHSIGAGTARHDRPAPERNGLNPGEAATSKDHQESHRRGEVAHFRCVIRGRVTWRQSRDL